MPAITAHQEVVRRNRLTLDHGEAVVPLEECTCCQLITQITDRLPRARRGGRQAPHGIRRNPPGQPRRVPLRGASQCLKSMSDQLAYRRVWQKVHARHRDFVTRTAREGPPSRELPRAPNRSPKLGGPLHIPLRAVSPAKKDVLASQSIISKGVP